MTDFSKPSILTVLNHFDQDTTRLHEDSVRWQKIKCPNPEHDDRSPSCSISTSLQRFHCFSCSALGDSIDLIALIKGCDLRAAFDYARRELGLESSAVSRAPAKPERWRPAAWRDDD